MTAAAAAAVLRPYLVTHLTYPARGAPARRPCLPFPLLAYRTPTSPKSSHSSTIDPIRKFLFIPPGVEPGEIAKDMVLPGSNIVVGPYAGHSHIKEVEFVGSSGRAKDCPKDGRPEFAVLGRSNVGKSSLINALVRKKEVALTSKKPGSCSLMIDRSLTHLGLCGAILDRIDELSSKFELDMGAEVRVVPDFRLLTRGSLSNLFSGKTQLINHFLVNKSWYIVDLPGYGFAKAPGSVRMDWSAFTKGYFLNRDTLVAVLLLVDASVPSQKIDLDCANWLGRNEVSGLIPAESAQIPMTFVFTKCDKMKGGKRPDENIRSFQELIGENYKQHPPWIMTSSVTGLGRDELLLHMSQLRNYWDQ